MVTKKEKKKKPYTTSIGEKKILWQLHFFESRQTSLSLVSLSLSLCLCPLQSLLLRGTFNVCDLGLVPPLPLLSLRLGGLPGLSDGAAARGRGRRQLLGYLEGWKKEIQTNLMKTLVFPIFFYI